MIIDQKLSQIGVVTARGNSPPLYPILVRVETHSTSNLCNILFSMIFLKRENVCTDVIFI